MGNCAFVCRDYYSTSTNTNNPSSTPLYHHYRQRRHTVVTTPPEQTSMIKVVTTTGDIMELFAPITVEQITSEFPNHGLFLGPNPTTLPPLSHNDNLCPGQLYYLLPLTLSSSAPTTTVANNDVVSTPSRMPVDSDPRVVYQPMPDGVSRHTDSGVWKVRLVIKPEHLSEILSQDNKTQQLIESARAVAKCGSVNTASSAAKKASLPLSSSSSARNSSNNSDKSSVRVK